MDLTLINVPSEISTNYNIMAQFSSMYFNIIPRGFHNVIISAKFSIIYNMDIYVYTTCVMMYQLNNKYWVTYYFTFCHRQPEKQFKMGDDSHISSAD